MLWNQALMGWQRPLALPLALKHHDSFPLDISHRASSTSLAWQSIFSHQKQGRCRSGSRTCNEINSLNSCQRLPNVPTQAAELLLTRYWGCMDTLNKSHFKIRLIRGATYVNAEVSFQAQHWEMRLAEVTPQFWNKQRTDSRAATARLNSKRTS